MLVASYDKACFALLKTTVFVELIYIYPHAIKDLLAFDAGVPFIDLYLGSHLLVALEVT